jgi:hypothetical protein
MFSPVNSAFTIFTILFTLNEQITAQNINKFRKLKIQNTKVYEEILFLKKCRSHGVFPKFIHVRVSVQNRRSWSAKEKAKRNWLNSEIKHKYGMLQNFNLRLYKLHNEITETTRKLPQHFWDKEQNKIQSTCEFIRSEKKEKLKKKFLKLKSGSNEIQAPENKKNFITNLAQAELTTKEM